MVKKPVMLVPLAVFAWLVLAWSASSAQEKDKADKRDLQAKEAAEQYLKAMKAHDIEAVMKIVEVPFFWDGVENIKDREKLKEGFLEIFKEKDLRQMEYKVKAVHAFGDISKKLREKDRELLNQILEKTDRHVQVAFQKDGIAIAVRIRGGKAKVAGFRD